MSTAGEGTRGRRAPLQLARLPQYEHCRAALDDTPEVKAIVAALEAAAAERPYAGYAAPGAVVRILRAHRYGNYPPVRLFYTIAETVVHLLWIEHFDELED